MVSLIPVPLLNNCRSSLHVESSANFSISLALLLVDPPVGETIFSASLKRKRIPVNHWEHFQGGYIDFLPPIVSMKVGKEQDKSTCGPPRTSMFDDIIYYCTQGSHHDTPRDTPRAAAFYAEKIAIATWMNAIEYIRKGIRVLEWRLHSVRKSKLPKTPREARVDLEWLDGVLSTLQDWKWRCSVFCDWMDNNLVALNIPVKDFPNLGGHDQKDWIYIHKMLTIWESRVKDLMGSAYDSLALLESTRSIDEAQATRLLAILGTIFLPLSLVASILSMSSDFLPGNRRFWVYIAVSLPLLLSSLLIAFMPSKALEAIEAWRENLRKKRTQSVPSEVVTPPETLPFRMV